MPHHLSSVSPRHALEASQDLVNRRRGVPMFVSLRSTSPVGDPRTETSDPPPAPPQSDDSALADAFCVYRDQLEGHAEEETEEETVVRTLQALAYTSLGPHRVPPQPSTPTPTPSPTPPPGHAHGSRRELSAELGVSAEHTADDLRAGQFLRMVNYHNTPASWKGELVAELRRYAEDFETVTVADLDRFSRTGVWHKSRPGLLPVFYEGYRDNYEVAAAACDEAGVVGWFFVCTAFVDTPAEAQYDYALAHRIKLVPENPRGERIAMSWDEIGDLHRRGHVVTPHTASHALARKVLTQEHIEREVVEPKRLMDRVTGGSALCTAWLEGTSWTGESPADRALVEAGYRFVFSNTMVQRLPD
ncbi:polysaccharide deacetylase family protein [Streptomyces sp. Je 1-332]|uniref:polysaccharide deacetylase family protein n=1 Tax=Streptomyces sp. Je 1-332 TaxID=3231270 RepID=UPI0034584D8A